jgi:hypothetical protein
MARLVNAVLLHLPLLAMLPGDAVAAPPLQTREASGYLGLSGEQARRLHGLRHAWAQERQQLQAQVAKTADLADLCARSRARQAELMTQARELLDREQLQRLALLEQAWQLQPKVEAAQALLLLPATQRGAPAGLPQGSVETEFSYRRVAAAVLSGCPVDRVFPGTEDPKPPNAPRGKPQP